MFLILSPSTTLDFESSSPSSRHSQPRFLDEAEQLVNILRDYSEAELAELMKMSAELAALNWHRYQEWERPFTSQNAKPALFAFSGAVYAGLRPGSLQATDIDYAQEHVGILSGLYGLLRPLDLMQAYRLELKTPLRTQGAESLYAFWAEKLTHAVCDGITHSHSGWLLNLASNEYRKAIKKRLLDVPLLDVGFKEWKNGKFKTISFFAKEARGRMARYVVENQVREPEQLKDFAEDGYRYSRELSTAKKLVFTRQQAD